MYATNQDTESSSRETCTSGESAAHISEDRFINAGASGSEQGENTVFSPSPVDEVLDLLGGVGVVSAAQTGKTSGVSRRRLLSHAVDHLQVPGSLGPDRTVETPIVRGPIKSV
jgi:hypothetical protein